MRQNNDVLNINQMVNGACGEDCHSRVYLSQAMDRDEVDQGDFIPRGHWRSRLRRIQRSMSGVSTAIYIPQYLISDVAFVLSLLQPSKREALIKC